MSQGKYVRVSPDLELYYEEAGTGQPIVFIPGWAGTTEFYAHQMPHFSTQYHALTYDPRSHGRSSKTLENNHYIQHGHDLKAFIDALGLKDVILVSLSGGCYDVYAYFRAYGTDNVQASIFIDEPPWPSGWTGVADMAEWGDFVRAVIHDLRGLIPNLIRPMMVREMTQDELDWASDQLGKTPNYAAISLIADFLFSDYTAEAKAIDGEIPVLNVVAEERAEEAKAWLAANAPHSKLVALGEHLMLLEFPDQFNAAVEAFLQRIESKP